MPIRKSASLMSDAEWETFVRAVIGLKAEIINPNAPENDQISRYDQFTALHTAVLRVRTPDGGSTNMGHRSAGFCPWHREFLLRLENALVDKEPDAFLPYWDWTDHDGTMERVFSDTTLGARSGVVSQGFFAHDVPGTASNAVDRPDWWPDELDGWRVPPLLQFGHGAALARVDLDRRLATDAHIDAVMESEVYEGGQSNLWVEPDTGAQVFLVGGFRTRIEGGPGGVPRTHNFGHGWIGGHMGDANTSPSDPIFYLHHANIDRVWAEWQADGHAGEDFYPDVGFDMGHNLEDDMWPWVGTAAGYLSMRAVPGIPLPDFTAEDPRKPVDVLNMDDLGYAYE